MQGLRREPGSVTAIRSRPSSFVTSTVTARRRPTFAWTTLLVTSSLTSSAASDAAAAGMWPARCEPTDLRARAGASSPPGIRKDIDRGESGGWNADSVMRRPAFETVAAASEWSEGHARPKRVADDPSFECSRGLFVGAPRPDQEMAGGGCPLPPAQQRDLGVDEASKVYDQPAGLPAAEGVQWRARRTWIGRGRSAIRAVRPGYASTSFWAFTGGPPGHGPPPWSPVASCAHRSPPEARRDRRMDTAKRFAEIRRCGAWHRAPAVGRMLLLQPPPHAAIGRRERALISALMPGCPARGRRSQTSTAPTLLRSQPNTRVQDTAFGYA